MERVKAAFLRAGVPEEQCEAMVSEETRRRRAGDSEESRKAQDFVKKNRRWLYGKDGKLSEEGLLFREFVAKAEADGIKSVARQQAFAMRGIRAHRKKKK